MPELDLTARTATPDDVRTTWHQGCPVAVADLAVVHLNHHGFDGRVHRGELVVAARFVPAVARLFGRALADGFPIRQMINPDAFGGDDEAMMEADNTSCFNYRVVPGTDRISQHGYGAAVDVNPRENPYYAPQGWLPPSGGAFIDRSRREPGMHHPGTAFVTEVEALGGRWGAEFDDYHHFDFVHPSRR